MNVLTVSQINFYIKSILEQDKNLNNVYVSGEISNFTKHYKSGHMYFSLKDEKGIIKAIVFSSFASRIRFIPADGMKVIVRGSISLYEPSGVYQIYVEDMQPQGMGAFNLAYEQLKDKLFKEGLFDTKFKKKLPEYPERIGVITSKTGAVFHDIQKILKRRYPLAKIIFYPALVQGTEAPVQIVRAIEVFNNLNAADVLIVGRGGGSIEDLWAFNDESLARAIFESSIPVISAVGHETDYTICDFVADLRAPTPSAAAELAVPDIVKLKLKIDSQKKYMEKMLVNKVNANKEKLAFLISNISAYNPAKLIKDKKMSLEVLKSSMNLAFYSIITEKKKQFIKSTGKLNALSPLRLLSSGYAMLKSGNKVIKSISKVKKGEILNAILVDGELTLEVKKIEKAKEGIIK